MGTITLPERLEPLRSPMERVRAADPLLMSAAIAYNAFFALVPLVLGSVAALSLFRGSQSAIDLLEQLVSEGFPAEVAAFITSIVQDAQSIVSGWEGPILVLSLLVALYAGSRGVYAVQKALRQIQGVEEDRPYWRARGLGVVFTLGAGVALIGGYLVVFFSRQVAEVIEHFGLSVSMSGFSTGVLAVWVVVLLYAIYRWGPPDPFARPLIAALVATAIIALMTWAAAFFIPNMGSSTLAVLGVVGIVLIWLYALGMVIIIVPAFTAPALVIIFGAAE